MSPQAQGNTRAKPLYDQSTYIGRLRHFAEVTNPRNLLATPSQLLAAKRLVDAHQSHTPITPPPTSAQLLAAKRLVDSNFHPDTGETILLPFRMACFVPTNALIVAGMLVPNPSTAAIVFWQVVNQSVNVAFNYCNANKSAVMDTKETAIAYTTAVASSCTIALGMNAWVSRLRGLSPLATSILGRCVPFTAVAAAGTLNVFLMRQKELTEGISVLDKDGNVVGKSQKAGFNAISQVAVSRVATAFPAVFLPGLIMTRLERTAFVRSNPRLAMPLNLAVICGSLMAALPCAVAIYPQVAEVPVAKLEPRFQGLRDKDGAPI
ncbi:hypothetical protein HK101_011160, partial [Irineochytrium annulatum]